MRRKKWLFFSLALVGCLALSLAVFSRGTGNEQAAGKEKLPTFVKHYCELYKALGVHKLSEATAARKKLAPERLQYLLAERDAEPSKRISPRRDVANPLDLLVVQHVQKRWGNPSFDVVRGNLVASREPQELVSPYFKILNAWKWKGAWHVSCEFALFMAEEIAAQDAVVRLDLAPTPVLDNDLGSKSTGAPRLRVGTPGDWDPSEGYTGAGVIVGDVDTGIDWTHGDFWTADGHSRIMYLWDTTVDTDGRTPYDLFGMTWPGIYGESFDYGTIYTRQEIEDGLCPEFDDNGHGTHTCGTAAGNGGATGKYTGMAPNADIIFVKGLDMNGIEFIFEVGYQLGIPAVVNNSYGFSWKTYIQNYPQYIGYFPGDGTCYESQYMDYLRYYYPQGAIACKSAGNNGMWQTLKDPDNTYGYALYNGSHHCGDKVGNKNTLKHLFYRKPHPAPEGYGIRSEYNTFWVRSDKPVQVTVETGPETYVFRTGEWGNFTALSSAEYYDMDYYDYYNGEYCGFIRFWEYNTDPGWGPGNWKFHVKPLNAGDIVTFDIWMDNYTLHWGDEAHSYYLYWYDSCFTKNSMHKEYQLDWAASADIITVGAWTTRSKWLGADGQMHGPWWEYGLNIWPKLNTITYFSSPGPSRDGRMKPDIAAPGACIMSALSDYISVDPGNMDPDGEHQWMWGTSMSCPHAVGGIALMLQKYPNLNVDEVRAKLANWAIKDNQTRAIGKNGFGAGKLNVLPLRR